MEWFEVSPRASRNGLQDQFGAITDECWAYLNRLMRFEVMNDQFDWIEGLGLVISKFSTLTNRQKNIIALEIESFDNEDDSGNYIDLVDWLTVLFENLESLEAEHGDWPS